MYCIKVNIIYLGKEQFATLCSSVYLWVFITIESEFLLISAASEFGLW